MYMKIDSGTLTNLWFNVSDSRQNAEITASPNPLEAKVIPTPKPENRQAPSSCFLITPEPRTQVSSRNKSAENSPARRTIIF